MPEPNRAPWQVHADIAPLYGWPLLESGLTLGIECDGCGRTSAWPNRLLKRNVAKLHRAHAGDRVALALCQMPQQLGEGQLQTRTVALSRSLVDFPSRRSSS